MSKIQRTTEEYRQKPHGIRKKYLYYIQINSKKIQYFVTVEVSPLLVTSMWFRSGVHLRMDKNMDRDMDTDTRIHGIKHGNGHEHGHVGVDS